MKIELTSGQEAYLRSLVKSGVYRTIEDAIDDMLSPAVDDRWMKPLVDEAIADVQAGRVDSWEVETLRRELRTRHPDVTGGDDR